MQLSKSDIDKLEKLNEQTQALKATFDARVQIVAERYMAANRYRGRHDFPGRPTYQVDRGEWQLASGEIVVTWEETWQFGGHAEGEFQFPAKYLYNEDALLAHEEKCMGEKAEAAAKEQEEQRQKDEADLARLQKKLGK